MLSPSLTHCHSQADDGLIQYPYSTREVVNIVKHLERFPDEGLGAVVREDVTLAYIEVALV